MNRICPLCKELRNIRSRIEKRSTTLHETITQEFLGVLHSWEASLTHRCTSCKCNFGEGILQKDSEVKEGVGEIMGSSEDSNEEG